MNWSDLLQWEGNPLSQQAHVYEQQARAVTNASEDLSDRANGLSGSGQTVTAAQQALRKNVEEMRKQAESLHSLASLSESAAKGAHEIGEAARTLDREAADKSIKIGADGSLDYVGKKGSSITDAIKIASDMGAVSDRVSAIQVVANELVEDTQKNIAAVESGGQPQAGGDAGSRLNRMKLPPKGASPDEVAKWWSSLTDAEKAEMVKRHPREIGNLNGVEATWRDKANRKSLEEDIKNEQNKYNKLEQARQSGNLSDADKEEPDKTKKRLDAMNNIKATLDRQGKDGVQRQLVSYDPAGDGVLAAVAQGNYDTKATIMRENAEKHSNGQSVAMVTYMDYTAPQSVGEVTEINYARHGSDRLAGFLNGVDASREHGAGDAHITLAGHSYGSTTAGMAAAKVNDGVVDDLVQFGSPGSGVQDVSEFNVPKGHAWVSATDYRRDIVQGMGPDWDFGKDPAKMKGYKHLSGDVGAADPDESYVFSKHSGYFNKDSKALDDISSVIAGKEPK